MSGKVVFFAVKQDNDLAILDAFFPIRPDVTDGIYGGRHIVRSIDKSCGRTTTNGYSGRCNLRYGEIGSESFHLVVRSIRPIEGVVCPDEEVMAVLKRNLLLSYMSYETNIVGTTDGQTRTTLNMNAVEGEGAGIMSPLFVQRMR